MSETSSLSSCAKAKANASRCRMASVKEWMNQMRPARLVIVLVLSIVYFLILLAFSHITHSLALLVQCYHLVCNIIALSGGIVMVKVSICRLVSGSGQTAVTTRVESNLARLRVYYSLRSFMYSVLD